MYQQQKWIQHQTYFLGIWKSIHIQFAKTYSNLYWGEQLALREFKSYKDKVIKEADKGSAVVVLDIENYLNEAQVQIRDSNVYELVEKGPLKNIALKCLSHVWRFLHICILWIFSIKKCGISCFSKISFLWRFLRLRSRILKFGWEKKHW